MLLMSSAYATGRFVNISAFIVLDRQTGLLWEARPPVKKMSYFEAIDYCANLQIEKTGQWRLPHIKELASIIDESSYNPSIYPYFKSERGLYWSITLNAADHDYAWLINFNDGHIHSFRNDTQYFVRCVRSATL